MELLPNPFLCKCCDVCSCSCQCDDCLDGLAIAVDEVIAVQDSNSVTPSLSRKVQLELHEALEQYRKSLLDDLESPPLFGIEAATGITNHLIDDVTNNTHKYTSKDVFLRLGMTRCQAGELYRIISDYL